MNWLFLNLMAATLIVSWWLSGFDSHLSGHDDRRRADFLRRAVRCGVSLLLMGIAVGGLQGGALGPLGTIAVALPLGIVWASCLSELFARGFYVLIDSEDKRHFDPKHVERELDRLASLVQSGRSHEAVELCRHLQESGDASTLAMETMLFRLYDQMYADDRIATAPALEGIWKVRGQRRFDDAEARLNQLLQREPDNLAAALLLLRVCAQDLQRPDKAQALLEALAQNHRVLPVFLEFARRRVAEWSGAAPPRNRTEGIESLLVHRPPPPRPVVEAANAPEEVSLDELLADGRLATAVELLEDALAEQKLDFELWLKLAEVHAVHCHDLGRAARIIKSLEDQRAFQPEQIQLARAKLREWQTAAKP